jgi:hypothetical protein
MYVPVPAGLQLLRTRERTPPETQGRWYLLAYPSLGPLCRYVTPYQSWSTAKLCGVGFAKSPEMKLQCDGNLGTP